MSAVAVRWIAPSPNTHRSFLVPRRQPGTCRRHSSGPPARRRASRSPWCAHALTCVLPGLWVLLGVSTRHAAHATQQPTPACWQRARRRCSRSKRLLVCLGTAVVLLNVSCGYALLSLHGIIHAPADPPVAAAAHKAATAAADVDEEDVLVGAERDEWDIIEDSLAAAERSAPPSATLGHHLHPLPPSTPSAVRRRFRATQSMAP